MDAKPYWCPLCERNHKDDPPKDKVDTRYTREGEPILFCLTCAVQGYYETRKETRKREPDTTKEKKE